MASIMLGLSNQIDFERVLRAVKNSKEKLMNNPDVDLKDPIFENWDFMINVIEEILNQIKSSCRANK